MGRIDGCELALLHAAAAIGHLFHSGYESEAYVQARSDSLRLAFNEPPLSAKGILDFISALILIVYTEFGCNNIKEATNNLDKACNLALSYGLNALDLQGDSIHGNSLLAGMCQGCDVTMEAGRRVWWEVSLAARGHSAKFTTAADKMQSSSSSALCRRRRAQRGNQWPK